jgi:hypothetical protein
MHLECKSVDELNVDGVIMHTARRQLVKIDTKARVGTMAGGHGEQRKSLC